jgi:hypothetical protein
MHASYSDVTVRLPGQLVAFFERRKADTGRDIPELLLRAALCYYMCTQRNATSLAALERRAEDAHVIELSPAELQDMIERL